MRNLQGKMRQEGQFVQIAVLLVHQLAFSNLAPIGALLAVCCEKLYLSAPMHLTKATTFSKGSRAKSRLNCIYQGHGRRQQLYCKHENPLRVYAS